MNKKVFTSMLSLCVLFLVGLYFLKTFFPQEFAMQITNERFVSVGNFVDSHVALKIVCTYITSFVTYYLYLCAVCEQKTLKLKQIGFVLLAITGSILVEKFALRFLTHYSTMAMFGLPLLFKGKFDKTFIVFSVHGISQVLSLGIRGIMLNIGAFNFTIGLAMTLECYLWLLLFYLIFNYEKKEI